MGSEFAYMGQKRKLSLIKLRFIGSDIARHSLKPIVVMRKSSP